MSETLVFYSEFDPFETWREALAAQLPGLTISEAAGIADPEAVRYALVWKPPRGFFARFPNLELITILGAGADALVTRDDLPDIAIARLSDPQMARMMAGYVLFSVLRYARDIPVLEAAQREGRWHYVHPREAGEIRVGVMGLGELGGVAAQELARQGFDVRGWSRTPKVLEGVKTVSGAAALDPFLTEADILVVMLPLTPETRQILDRRRLSLLPEGAKLINVSRGAIIDEAALVEALGSGALGGATLDVFEHEPLAPGHPLWTSPNVLITPHLASVALPGSAAAQIADNIGRVRRGEAVLHGVDVRRGY